MYSTSTLHTVHLKKKNDEEQQSMKLCRGGTETEVEKLKEYGSGQKWRPNPKRTKVRE